MTRYFDLNILELILNNARAIKWNFIISLLFLFISKSIKESTAVSFFLFLASSIAILLVGHYKLEDLDSTKDNFLSVISMIVIPSVCGIVISIEKDPLVLIICTVFCLPTVSWISGFLCGTNLISNINLQNISPFIIVTLIFYVPMLLFFVLESKRRQSNMDFQRKYRCDTISNEDNYSKN